MPIKQLKQKSVIQNLTESVLKFRDERDWKQFHNPKDSAIALASEAIEVLDELKWKNEKEIEEYLEHEKHNIAHELSDVMFWVLLLAHDLDIDLEKSFTEKMKLNEKKYPVDKAKGKHTKYTKL